jgi:oxaloacetate decarboxylase alpha subunit/pyruvate carboxylase subunit B
VPIDFHTHCTPGFGLGAVLTAIMHGVDVVDTVIWNFAGGPAAPALELIYIFCQKLGVELDVNMEAVAKINEELLTIRQELDKYDAVKQFPNPFNPLTDKLPAEVDQQFDRAIAAVKNEDEEVLLQACHAIEAYFGFPAPDEQVKNAEIPGGMYTNMVAQLKQFNALEILPEAMKLIPSVRRDAGLPPLVTPTSQIVGAQAVNSALNQKNGRPKYANPSNQFVALVKGEYGKTPIPVDPEFRYQIAGTREEVEYDTSTYKRQDNPTLEEYGGVRLAKDEKEELLMELFPAVATGFLRKLRQEEWEAQQAALAAEEVRPETAGAANDIQPVDEVVGHRVKSPMYGTILEVLVKVGDSVKKGDNVVILEAMKMENEIATEVAGKVHRIFVTEGEIVKDGAPLVEIV